MPDEVLNAPIDITKEQWISLLRDEEIITEKDLRLLKKKLYLTPLSDIGEKYRVDPINDLRPVCPNCHAIIHAKNPPYSIDEVVAMMRNTRTE